MRGSIQQAIFDTLAANTALVGLLSDNWPNMYGPNLVTNGTFDTDFTGWDTVGGGWSVTTDGAYYDGTLDPGVAGNVTQTDFLTTGLKYRLDFDAVVNVGTISARLGRATEQDISAPASGSYDYEEIADGDDLRFRVSIDGDGAVDNVVVRQVYAPIFSYVPQTENTVFEDFPFVTIGATTLGAFATDDWSGGEAVFDIHVWSRAKGDKEANEVLDAIRAALDRVALNVTGYKSITCDFEQSETVADPDGETRHGVITFRALITT